MQHFVNRITGTIILVNEGNEKEIKRYQEDKDYYQYFTLVN